MRKKQGTNVSSLKDLWTLIAVVSKGIEWTTEDRSELWSYANNNDNNNDNDKDDNYNDVNNNYIL